MQLTFVKFKMKRYCTLLLLALIPLFALQAQVKVSLVLSDNYTKAGYEVVQRLNRSLPGFDRQCTIKIYSYSELYNSDISFLEQSDLVFAYVHFAPVFEQAKPHILKAIKRGAKVYALGATPAEAAYKADGVIFNRKVLQYFDQTSIANLQHMILFRLEADLALKYPYNDVIQYPETGIYSLSRDTVFTDVNAFRSSYANYRPGRPWIGIYTFRYEILTGQHAHLDTHIQYLERAGFNVMPFFGIPLTTSLKQYCLDSSGRANINLLVTTSSIPGSSPEALRAAFNRLWVPVINAISLDQSAQDWSQSMTGLSVFSRTLNLGRPELTGQIQPTVTSSQETTVYADGVRVIEKKAITDRVQRLVARVQAWDRLQQKANHEKHVALIYYVNPPGKENIGASYLNVLPASLYNILHRMEQEGYDLGSILPDSNRIFDDIMNQGRNIGHWAPAEIERLAVQGMPVLVAVSEYKEWFSKLNPRFQQQVLDKWGAPDSARIMTWRDHNGNAWFVLPAVRYGKLLLTPQPPRGWDADVEKMYHDVTLPPHHQYIAFYLYLRHKFQADAVIHVGTHGTHEWLNGKETGLNDDDAPEALIADLVNIYPYIVDDVGEGLQAKRRGMAVVIDHLTPPFDKAGLNPDLKELGGLINDYISAAEKSEVLAAAKLKGISKLALKLGLLKDLGIAGAITPEHIQQLEHYVREIGERQTPFGLHTFGTSPSRERAAATAAAIADRQGNLAVAARDSLISDITEKISSSGNSELNALIAALNGRYIPAAQGNDPLRNPASLPTGKNFYAFDPSKIPSEAVFEAGSKLAEEMIGKYRQEHNGQFPDKVTFNLWSVETIRHEGVMEAQILQLLGVKPTYDGYGRVSGVALIPRNSLRRPRVDVVMIPSGLYRDMFPNLMELLDQAVSLARQQEEPDNHLRQHTLSLQQQLIQQGVQPGMAARLASVRMFSVPSGAYGTGLENVIQASGTWDKEAQVADVYFNKMSHLYGQGFWGDKAEGKDSSLPAGFSVQLLKGSLSGTKAVVHSRSSNLYGALDNDDFFQYLGGTAMAVRAVDGATPDVIVTNLSGADAGVQESLDKYIGREMKTRYLNPAWINEMLDEGYAGARLVNNVVANLWGWQVTVPGAIDENKWQQLFDTYVEDKFQLGIKEKFRKANNMYAYQVALSRMLEVVRKNYWHPGEAATSKLMKEYLQTVQETGLSCNENVCDNPALTGFIEEKMKDNPQELEQYRKQLTDIKKTDRNRERKEQKVPDAQLRPYGEVKSSGKKAGRR